MRGQASNPALALSTAYGVVLCDTGRWTEAEVEILHAFGPNATKAVSKQADAAGALARLRLMQGRLDEVSDLLAPDCRPLRGLRAAGVSTCCATSQTWLPTYSTADCTISSATDSGAGRLLELLVEVELARDHPDGAELALERLEACALASRARYFEPR